MRVSNVAIAMLALTSTAAATGEKKAEQAVSERVICEKQEVIGSRLATRRVCMTAEEWRIVRSEGKAFVDKLQRVSTQKTFEPPPPMPGGRSGN
ncbi:MAG TPA: hypothetical protein VGD23_11030 [Sphingomicrobium sp.]